MWKKKFILPAFFIPFVLFGCFYSYIALNYLSKLPPAFHQPPDLAYAVFVSFLDMGVAGGLGSLVVFSLLCKLITWIRSFKLPFFKVSEP